MSELFKEPQKLSYSLGHKDGSLHTARELASLQWRTRFGDLPPRVVELLRRATPANLHGLATQLVSHHTADHLEIELAKRVKAT